MVTEVLTKEEQEILEINEAVEESFQTNVTFRIHTPLLQSLIAQVERAVSKLTTVDILKGIYLQIEEDKLTLRAVNNEFGTEIKVKQQEIIEGKRKAKNFEITEGKPGNFVIMTKNFKAMINKLPRNFATITANGKTALIKSGSTKYNLLVLDGQEFPAFPNVDESNEINIAPEQLLSAYDKTAYAVSVKDSRIALTGLNHQIKDSKLFFTATDGHQLSRMALELDEDTTVKELNVTIPLRSVEEIRKQVKGSNTVSIRCDKSNAIFEFDNVVLFSRVFEENYPDVSKMIPTQFTTEIRFTAKELKDMLDRSLLLYEGTTATASLRSIPELRQLRLSSHEDGVGVFEEDLGATEGAGEPIHIGVNLRFLNEAVKVHAPGDLLKIQFISNLKPFIISNAAQEVDDNINLVLPVRLHAYDKEVTIKDFNAPIQIEADYDFDSMADEEDEEAIKPEPTEEIKEEINKLKNNPFAHLNASVDNEEYKTIPVDENQQNAFTQD